MVIAVTALLAASAQALGPEPHFSGQVALKVDISESNVGWPFEYKALDMVVIPVHLQIGYRIEVGWPIERKQFYKKPPDPVYRDPNDILVPEDWDKWRFDLRQVSCGDIGRETEADWPCFLDCETITIRANFDVELSIKLHKASNLIDQWEAYFDDTNIVTGSGEWETVKICVVAWRAKLLEETSATKVKVGDVIVTVKPKL